MKPKLLKKHPSRTVVVATDRGPYKTVFHVVAPNLEYLGAFTEEDAVQKAIEPYLHVDLQRDAVRRRHLLGYAEQYRVGTIDVVTGELSGNYYDVRGWFPAEVAQDLEDSWSALREQQRHLMPEPIGTKQYRGFGSWVPPRKD